MKRVLFPLLLLAVTTTTWAQQGRGRRQAPPSLEERLELAKEQLSLTEDQVADWETIFEKYDNQIQEARENRDREAGENLRTALNEELLATLDEA